MLFILFFTFGLSGCDSTRVRVLENSSATPYPQWHDNHFQLTNIAVPDQASIFWLDDEAVQFAEKARFSAQFQQVHIPEYWTERDGQSFINIHVNVRIQPGALMRKQMLFPHMTVVDFEPIANRASLATNTITKERYLKRRLP